MQAYKTGMNQNMEESNMIEKKLAEMMAAMYKSERVFTLAESRKRVEYQGKFVEFDSGSFYVYKHNLDRFQCVLWVEMELTLKSLSK